MHTLSHRTQIFTLSVVTVALLLVSNLATADIYKWRNNRGVIQYSDKPPVSGFSKADKHEIVNSLQSKDMCVEPTAKTAAAATAKFSANFFGFTGGSSGVNNTAAPFGFIPARPATVVTAPISSPIFIPARPATVAAAPRPSPVFGFAGPVTVAAAPRPSSIFGFTVPVTVVAAPRPSPIVTAFKPPVTVLPPAAPPAAPASAAPPLSAALPPAAPPSPASTTQNIIQSLLLPAVDINKNVVPAVGFSNLRIEATGATTNPNPGEGAFRITCSVSHMSNDDPIVFPNQKGAAHHHTFFGNTSINYATNVNNIATVGNSTCAGGIANRSAYWVPSMIDTTTNTPISDISPIIYYKTGYGGVPTNLIVAPPKGLRMIAGNARATTAAAAKVGYSCIPKVGFSTRWTPNIQNCNVGDTLVFSVGFPQCWDGKNLDSPDHISHMANADNFPTANKCPSTHPVAIPAITINAKYQIKKPNEALNWRLASDNYAASLPGGYSGHADWINGWDEAVMAGIIKNCINASVDCHAYLLGNGTTLF